MRSLISSLGILTLLGLVGCDDSDELLDDLEDVVDNDGNADGGAGGIGDEIDLPGGGGPGSDTPPSIGEPVPVGELDQPDLVDGGGVVAGGGSDEGGGGGGGETAECPDVPDDYWVDFRGLNDQDVTGFLWAKLYADQQLGMWIRGEGFEPSRPISMVVYGIEGGDARCATALDDFDEDGTLTREELAGPLGAPVLDLGPVAVTNANGDLSADPVVAALGTCPLLDRAVVLFGGVNDGVWDPELPVACGDVRLATDEDLEGMPMK